MLVGMNRKRIATVKKLIGDQKIKVLGDIFKNSVGIPPGVKVDRYRANHSDWLDILDRLESEQNFLSRQQRDAGRYQIRVFALSIINDPHAKELVRLMNSIYAYLKKAYLENLSSPLMVSDLIATLDLGGDSAKEALAKDALYYMSDAHAVWSGLSTGFPYVENATISVSEAVLRHQDFSEVVDEFYDWHILKPAQKAKRPAKPKKKRFTKGRGEANTSVNEAPKPSLPEVRELPERILHTYSRLWQLETWLRRLVYIELRAFAGDDWESKVRKGDGSRLADKRLTHMPTPENDLLSYVQFAEIRRLISDEWRLFSPYLPPQNIWEAKLEEVAQIRHRVAHFRLGHEDDLQRVVQLLRDIDKGVWLFCTSFNDPHPVLPQSEDPVVQHFLPLDLLPWTEVQGRKWARVGTIDPNAAFTVAVEVLCRPWATWSTPVAGNEGMLYEVRIYVRHIRHLEFDKFLKGTQDLHKHFVHICLDDAAKDIRVTIPAILGTDKVIELVDKLVEATRYCISSGEWPPYKGSIQTLANAWPEYVLGPENPLTFLSPDQPCSFFGV